MQGGRRGVRKSRLDRPIRSTEQHMVRYVIAGAEIYNPEGYKSVTQMLDQGGGREQAKRAMGVAFFAPSPLERLAALV
jgi:hypothetical protein